MPLDWLIVYGCGSGAAGVHIGRRYRARRRTIDSMKGDSNCELLVTLLVLYSWARLQRYKQRATGHIPILSFQVNSSVEISRGIFMLAPSLIDCESDLAAVWSLLLNMGGFCQSCMSASLAQVDPPVSWVPEVQQILDDGRGVAQQWLTSRQSSIPTIVSTFDTYGTLISATVSTAGSSQDVTVWSDALTALRAATAANSQAIRQAASDLAMQQSAFQRLHDSLETTLQLAHDTVGAEEAEIAAVEVKVQALMDRLQSLGVAVSSGDMAAGTAMIQNVATIVYEVMIEGETAVPFLAVAAVLYSVGSGIYNIVSTDAQIASLLSELAKDMGELSADARILAMCRALIATLVGLLNVYNSAMQAMPRLNTYWDGETGKIDELLNALRQGPVAGLSDVATLGVAQTVWQQLAKTADAMILPVQSTSQSASFAISVPQPAPANS